MKEELINQGWELYYWCNCGGGSAYFNNKNYPNFEIRTKDKSQTFSIVQNNNVISGPNWSYQLKEKLNTYIQ